MKSEQPRSGFFRQYILYFLGAVFVAAGLHPMIFASLSFFGIGINHDAAGLIYLSVFAVGCVTGVLILAWHTTNFSREQAKAKEQWPTRPWMWRSEWRKKKIAYSSSTDAWLYASLAFFWNHLCWGGLVLVSLDGASNHVLIHVGIFCVIGLGMLGVAFRFALLGKKWGQCYLELHDVPIGIGEKLVGKIHVAHQCDLDDGITLTLCCSRKSQGKRNVTSLLWNEVSAVKSFLPTSQPGSTSLPVAFDIPPDAVGTSDQDRVSWALSVRSERGWLPYRADFDVPVYEIRPRPSYTTNQRKISNQFALHLGDRSLHKVVSEGYGRIICDTPNRIEIQIGLATLWNTLGVVAVVAAFLFMFLNLAWNDVGMMALMGIGVLAVTLPGFATTRICADSENLCFRRGYFWFGWKRTIAITDIESIEPSTAKERNGVSQGLKLRTKDGGTLTLLARLASHEVGSTIADRLNEHRERLGAF